MGHYTFRKSERLKKEKHIQELFTKGSSFYLFPFKVLLLPVPDIETIRSHQVLISVSKRNFPKAVDRNTLKRRIREAYRLEKAKLPSEVHYHIGLLYTHKEILPFADIFVKMVHVVKRIKGISSENLKAK